MPIKVLLADDSNMMRDAMRRILESERQIEVVGEAGSFGPAMQMIADFKPEVLLLDIHWLKNEISDLHWSNRNLDVSALSGHQTMTCATERPAFQ
jgi:DNA-binding NarL/FixJ family response regulator